MMKNNIGFDILLGIAFILILGVLFCWLIEKKRKAEDGGSGGKGVEATVLWKRLFFGMLLGFMTFVNVGITQFVLRFGYFSVLQEIGAISLGFIGTITGGLLALFKYKRPRA